MSKDDIIRMAREAGLHLATDVNWMPIIGIEYLERFAGLVAKVYEDTLALQQRSYEREIEIEVEAEREACAKVAKETVCDMHLGTGIKIYGTKAAAAIRARGQEA
jgi:polysaccharide pyruvyl transferase WcaK-like protein